MSSARRRLIDSARRWPLERHANVRRGLPSNTAFSQRTAGIESKVEFAGEVRSAMKLQAGTMIAQITDDTAECRTACQDEGGSFEYYRSLKAPSLKHGQT